MGTYAIMRITDDDLARWKETFAKDGIVYETDDEYREAISNLVGFFDILIQIDREQKNSPPHSNNDDGMYVYDKDGNKVIL